jgi:hypothetical protein
MPENEKINAIKQVKQILWREDSEYVTSYIKSHDIMISKKDFTISMNGKFNVKGSKSLEEAKQKAISLLAD